MQLGFYDTKSKCKICFIELVLYITRFYLLCFIPLLRNIQLSIHISVVVYRICKLICWMGSLFTSGSHKHYSVSSGLIVRFVYQAYQNSMSSWVDYSDNLVFTKCREVIYQFFVRSPISRFEYFRKTVLSTTSGSKIDWSVRITHCYYSLL